MRPKPVGSHLPVMVAEVLEALSPKGGEIAIDCTLGAGGHSLELLKKIGPTGRLIAFDLDPGNLKLAQPKLIAVGHPYQLHQTNFAAISTIVPEGADVVLADLGISSMQIDDPTRGFSYRRPGPLDMRMDQNRGKTAAQLLQTMDPGAMERTLIEYGDFEEFGPSAANHLAQAIIKQRDKLKTTDDLTRLILATIPPPPPPVGKRIKPWQLQYRPVACAYQALRIMVNRELANLEALLRSLSNVLKPGGRVAIISFHSGEDRLVKSALTARKRDGTFAAISADPIRPTYQERINNPRSRSAKLRFAVRRSETHDF